jgi:hypothetical protein
MSANDDDNSPNTDDRKGGGSGINRVNSGCLFLPTGHMSRDVPTPSFADKHTFRAQERAITVVV